MLTINPNGDTHTELNAVAFSYRPIVLNRWRNPIPAYAMDCPSPDGYKTRAARLIGDGLNCTWSGRRGYTVSPTKLAKFLKMYFEGWDASPITGKLDPPKDYQK
jgi:hypothetical protein